jgi:hypothetical protein
VAKDSEQLNLKLIAYVRSAIEDLTPTVGISVVAAGAGSLVAAAITR